MSNLKPGDTGIAIGQRYRAVGDTWAVWEVMRLTRFQSDERLYAVLTFDGEIKVLVTDVLSDKRRYRVVETVEITSRAAS